MTLPKSISPETLFHGMRVFDILILSHDEISCMIHRDPRDAHPFQELVPNMNLVLRELKTYPRKVVNDALSNLRSKSHAQ